MSFSSKENLFRPVVQRLCASDFSVTVVQIFKRLTFTKQKNGRKYDPVYNLGVYNYPKNTPVFLDGYQSSSVLTYTMSIVEIQLWLYFQNNMPVFKRNMMLCTTR
jgi:hypothetical protein